MVGKARISWRRVRDGVNCEKLSRLSEMRGRGMTKAGGDGEKRRIRVEV